MYRPNEAKVRNLKTKDYLGKARLVAASDRSNAFTGFAGSEIKNAAGRGPDTKDDRPTDNISFAATNLVKPGLQSRRQQSEPPSLRDAFPPTPPPENDKATAPLSRGQSVRNGPKPMPAKLNIPESRSNDRYQKTMSPQSDRRVPSRAASVTRSPPQRSYSRNDGQRGARSRNGDDGYPDDVYDMYGGGGGGGERISRGTGSRRQPRMIEEEEEGSDYDSFDEGDFEMIPNRRGPPASSVSGSSRGQSRRPEIRKVRVKVHADDVRYIMVGTAVEFPDFVERIREKFGITRRFKIKMRDEDAPEDMITMGDQDDLDMAIMSVKQAARKARQDIGKLEVSHHSELPLIILFLVSDLRILLINYPITATIFWFELRY